MQDKRTKQTLCWNCRNAVGICSWARNGKPVKGWTATPTKIKVYGKDGLYRDSFIVRECPLFVEG